MNIVLIGFGAIGQFVAAQLMKASDARIKWVLCRPGAEQRAHTAIGGDVTPVNSITQITGQADLAIECAGHEALKTHGPRILAQGIDLIAVSSGALNDAQLAGQLSDCGISGGAKLHLLPGAIGAIDALSAAAVDGLDSVTYRGRKPPQGWRGSRAEQVIDLDNLKQAHSHFNGSARDAAQAYPKNANVAATIALAGLGFDATQVELIADPGISANIHELEATGAFGHFHFKITGNPLPSSPRSSALTAMSILRAIENRTRAVIV